MKSKPKHPHIVKKRSTHFLSAVRLLANTEPKILDSTISYGNGYMPALRLSVVQLRLFVFQRAVKTCPSPHSFPLQRTRNSSIDGIPHALIVTSFIFANIIKFDQLPKFLYPIQDSNPYPKSRILKFYSVKLIGLLFIFIFFFSIASCGKLVSASKIFSHCVAIWA